MSTSVWGNSGSDHNKVYSPSLLKLLLKQMMERFTAHGACIALYDEGVSQMRIVLHVRLRNAAQVASPSHTSLGLKNFRLPGRWTVPLEEDSVSPTPSPSSREPHNAHSTFDLEEVSPQQCELFAIGSVCPFGQGLIGHTWASNEAFMVNQEEYVNIYLQSHSFQTDVVPMIYLSVPIREATLADEIHGRATKLSMLGVIVLYQVAPAGKATFQQKQCFQVSQYAERVALYLQNERLRHSKSRTSEYLQLLQEISTAFPTSVKLSNLVENIYQFAAQVVDVSSVLLTLYDRDTERIYDVFAIWHGARIEGLTEQPVVALKEDRPLWWQVTQKEKHTLHFSPAQDPQQANLYYELLNGVWGDQRQAESFLLLPMKMFNRVIGSLSLTSKRPNAYHPEEIQVLETMVQIVTVSIENAKLYERDRYLLKEARQREEQLAAVNSALQSISSVLDMTELLNNLVESVAMVIKVNMCVFFQLSSGKEELVAHALYAPSSVNMMDDGSGLPEVEPPGGKGGHAELIKTIRLPFKGAFLEQLVQEGFFYLDAAKLEELAQSSEEGGAIFLEELHTQRMLMIPMTSQASLVGILAIPTPTESRIFRPKEIGTLLAICAQATSAIRNAQLFEEKQEAYAELQRLDKLKDEFLVTASHELRTPLSAISGYSTLLKRQGARVSPQNVSRYAGKIASAAQQLTDLVSSMTEAANISAVEKNLDLQMEPMQVFAAAEMAASTIALSARQEITLQIDPLLWIKGDGLRVRQVLTNLLENATKYSPPESHIQITALATTLAQVVSLMPEGQIDHEELIEQGAMPVVLVRVLDQGEGILPEDRERIFEKFVRATRSLTTPVRGSGLGLYICRRYLEAMGGKLWLELTVPNEGSVFSFYLPFVEPPVIAEEQDNNAYQTS
ncbi:MAG TPA: ATP-binding protein [Ktedonobacteraceae bacterium]|nr:ATP-binding protein [Ktedonobacteraceae bacterium]